MRPAALALPWTSTSLEAGCLVAATGLHAGGRLPLQALGGAERRDGQERQHLQVRTAHSCEQASLPHCPACSPQAGCTVQVPVRACVQPCTLQVPMRACAPHAARRSQATALAANANRGVKVVVVANPGAGSGVGRVSPGCCLQLSGWRARGVACSRHACRRRRVMHGPAAMPPNEPNDTMRALHRSQTNAM